MRDVAVVTHDIEGRGGVASMTYFLYEALQDTGGYRPRIVSLALSSADEDSVRFLAPTSWTRGVRTTERTHRGVQHTHVGGWGVEVEPFRYRPRPALDEVLSEFDLVQFVTGTPSWAYAARDVASPVFLWTATTVWEDRETRLKNQSGPRGWWRRTMTRRAQVYERHALEEVNEVFALSNYTHDNLQTQFSVDSTVAPQGVDADRFQPVLEPREDYILTVSRINDPRKRIPLLLRSYAEARQQCEAVPALYVVGDQPNAGIRETARELGIADHVQFMGRRPPNELVELYQHALCFVLSSDEEGLGIVIQEAMACGRPVVSTRSGGPETLIVDDETGILTPVDDAEALRDGMLRLVGDATLRQKMGKASRERVEEKFAEGVAREPFLEVYEKY